MKIKKGDKVIVIAGKYKGIKGKVLQSFPKESKLLVEGVNRIKCHIKPTKEQAGHIVDKESPIHVSNVAFWDEDNKTASKIGYKIEGGKKIRIAKKTGKEI